MTKRLLSIALLLGLAVNFITAQTGIAYDEDMSIKGVEVITEVDFTETIFFTDPENQLFYIDLEAVGEEVSLLVIRQDDQVVLKEDITKLPKNTIFEVDLKLLKTKAPYRLELTTSFGILTKDFSIKKEN